MNDGRAQGVAAFLTTLWVNIASGDHPSPTELTPLLAGWPVGMKVAFCLHCKSCLPEIHLSTRPSRKTSCRSSVMILPEFGGNRIMHTCVFHLLHR